MTLFRKGELFRVTREIEFQVNEKKQGGFQKGDLFIYLDKEIESATNSQHCLWTRFGLYYVSCFWEEDWFEKL